MPNLFEKAAYEYKTESVADFDEAEKKRQAESVAKSGLKSVDEIKPNMFERAASEYAKEKGVPDKPGKMPSELNLMRRRLGMEGGQTSPICTGLGGMAGFGIGTALAPVSGFSSFLIPALAGAGGAATGALTEGKNPLKEGLTEGALDVAIPGGARLAKPAFRLGREAIVKTFGGRAGVSEAAESLLRKWLSPTVKASELYEAAEATKAIIPYGETTKAVNEAFKNRVGPYAF